MRIAVTGQILDGTGYGEYARLVAWALHAAGHNLRARNYHYQPERPDRLGHKGELVWTCMGRDVDAPVDLSLIVYIPTSLHFLVMDDTINVALSMTESTIVPPDYTRITDESDARVLAVPSEWNRKAFHASGLRTPTTVIHPPVDPDLLRMKVRKRCDFVDYLSIFNWPAPHKNPKALVEAFCRAFTSSDPVRLTIKTAGASDEELTDHVHEAMRLSGVAHPPKIKVIVGSMTRQEVLGLYESSDVYVSSHRGEGWGLPIFESMAIGMPAIATAFSAPLEYMHPRNSYLVGYRYNEELSNADIDVDELARKMRRAFTHPEEARALGEAARAGLRGRFTAERTTRQVLEAARMAAGLGPLGEA